MGGLHQRKFLPSMGMLVAFETCARVGQFTAAAQELCLTQSAVSRQIRALEELIGVDLFVRDRQAVKLTPAGERYANDIREALRDISRATLYLKTGPDTGPLNLAILPTIGTRWLAPLLPKFLQRCPGITINLLTRLTAFDMDDEGIDAAIHYGLPDWPRADHDWLFDEWVIAACSREIKQSYGFEKPADLLRAPLLHLTSRKEAWRQWFETMGLTYNGEGMFIDLFSALTQATAAGLGVALLPEFLFKEEFARGDLVPAIEQRAKGAGSYYLVCSKSKAHYPPLLAFRQWLLEEAAKFNANPSASQPDGQDGPQWSTR